MKDKIGWLAAGLIGALAAAFFGVKVFPLYGEIGEQTAAIADKSGKLNKAERGGFPKDADINAYVDLQKYLDGVKVKTIDFYAEYDKDLEKWFEAIQASIGSGGTPQAATFATHFDTNKKKLEKKLADANILLGLHSKRDSAFPYKPVAMKPEDVVVIRGFNWENVIENQDPAKLTAPVMRLIQKRFWIRDRITRVITQKSAGDLKVQRLMEVYFPMSLDVFDEQKAPTDVQPGDMFRPVRYHRSDAVAMSFFKLPQFSSGMPTIGTFPNGELYLPNVQPPKDQPAPAVTPGQPPMPLEFGRSITVCFALQLPLENVPAFLERFLDLSTEPKMLVTLLSVRVYQYDQNESKKTETVVRGNKAAAEQRLKSEIVPIPPVVAVVAQVIDFEDDKARRDK